MNKILNFYNEKIRLPEIKKESKIIRKLIDSVKKTFPDEDVNRYRSVLSNLVEKYYKLGGQPNEY